MGKVIGLLIGVGMWALIFRYVENGALRAVCLLAALYLIASYFKSLKKKGGTQ